MTFVDSGAWFALMVPSDADHAAAATWMQSYSGRLLTTDYVIDETLTLLRSRGQGAVALAFGAWVFGPKRPAVVHYVAPSEIDRARDVFQRFKDKDWSFTDCTSKVVIESLGLTQAFAFDKHFRQFGTVAVVP